MGFFGFGKKKEKEKEQQAEQRSGRKRSPSSLRSSLSRKKKSRGFSAACGRAFPKRVEMWLGAWTS